MHSHLRTAIRYSIATARIADEYNQRISAANDLPKREVNMQFILDTGRQSSLAGFGKMFDNFLETNEMSNFTGYDMIPATTDKEHFDEAPIRKFAFVDTFDDKHYKCWESMAPI